MHVLTTTVEICPTGLVLVFLSLTISLRSIFSPMMDLLSTVFATSSTSESDISMSRGGCFSDLCTIVVFLLENTFSSVFFCDMKKV